MDYFERATARELDRIRRRIAFLDGFERGCMLANLAALCLVNCA